MVYAIDLLVAVVRVLRVRKSIMLHEQVAHVVLQTGTTLTRHHAIGGRVGTALEASRVVSAHDVAQVRHVLDTDLLARAATDSRPSGNLQGVDRHVVLTALVTIARWVLLRVRCTSHHITGNASTSVLRRLSEVVSARVRVVASHVGLFARPGADASHAAHTRASLRVMIVVDVLVGIGTVYAAQVVRITDGTTTLSDVLVRAHVVVHRISSRVAIVSVSIVVSIRVTCSSVGTSASNVSLVELI